MGIFRSAVVPSQIGAAALNEARELTASEPTAVVPTWLVVGCVSLCLFLTSYVGNALTVAVPYFVELYHCPPHIVTLATSAYATALACVLLPASILARHFGNKRIFVYGLIGCVLFTALIPLSPTVWCLFLGRFFQGASAALCLSTAMAIISEQVPSKQRFGAIGIAVCLTYSGVSLSLSFSGVIIDNIGYEWMFYCSAVAFALVLAVATKLPRSQVHAVQTRLPLTKIALFALAIGLFLLSLTTLATQELASYGLLVAVLVLALVAQHDYRLSKRFGLHHHATAQQATAASESKPEAQSQRESAPVEVVIPVHFLTHNRAFLACFLVSVTAYFSVMAEPVLLALFSQFTLGLSATTAGFIIVVQPITIALVSACTGRLTRYLSGNTVVTLGLIIQTIALGSFVFIDETTTPLDLIIRQLFVGTGFALFSAPNTTLLTFAVGRANFALASSTQQVGRSLGQAASLALVSLTISAVVTALPNTELYRLQFADASVLILAISALSGLLGIVSSVFGWHVAKQAAKAQQTPQTESQDSAGEPIEAEAAKAAVIQA